MGLPEIWFTHLGAAFIIGTVPFIVYGLLVAGRVHEAVTFSRYAKDDCSANEILEGETVRFRFMKEMERLRQTYPQEQVSTAFWWGVAAWSLAVFLCVVFVVSKQEGVPFAQHFFYTSAFEYVGALVVLALFCPFAYKALNDLYNKASNLSVKKIYTDYYDVKQTSDDKYKLSKDKHIVTLAANLDTLPEYKDTLVRRYRATHPDTVESPQIHKNLAKTEFNTEDEAKAAAEQLLGLMHPASDYKLADRVSADSGADLGSIFRDLAPLQNPAFLDDTPYMSGKVDTVFGLLLFAAFVVSLVIVRWFVAIWPKLTQLFWKYIVVF